MKLRLVYIEILSLLLFMFFLHNSIFAYENIISHKVIKTNYDIKGKLLQPAGPFCITDAPVNLIASVTGGTWSGHGIIDPTNGTFDPSVAGAGNHTITYVSASGTETVVIRVYAAVNATITSAGHYCDNDVVQYLSAVSGGGDWSGTGITNASLGEFDPADAGVGVHIIQYTVRNGACVDTDTETITVYLSPVASFPSVPRLCETDTPFDIIPTNPGGTWSGTGITNTVDGTFDPSVAGPGFYMVTYTLSNANCTSEAIRRINVDTLVIATIDPAGPFCDDDTWLTLNTADIGGTWSGTGITDALTGVFDPAIAGVGTHTIAYNIISGACEDIDNIDITVLAAPDVTITNPGNFCSNDPVITLVAATSGGQWSGTGIVDSDLGTFDPSIATEGANTISYTISNAACTREDNIVIFVYEDVDATITPAGHFCDNEGVVYLTSADPGGVWSGTGITDVNLGEFDPELAGIGVHEITYSISNDHCSDSDIISIEVFLSPNPEFAGVSGICESDAPFDLVPVNLGGTWSGIGITDPVNGTFDPLVAGAGFHMITYTLSNEHCTSYKVRRLNVAPLVDATITPVGPFCEDEPEIVLTAVDPSGTWSGTGITNASAGTFDPAIAGAGLHTITYNVVAGVCSDIATIDIQVDYIPDASIISAGPFCETDAALNLSPLFPGGTWSGTGITDPTNGTFDPTIAGSGDFTITYDLTNGACSSQETTVIHVDEEVDATITGVPQICEIDPAFNLVAADPGGVWSGTGITNATNGTFDPTVAGPGLHSITYSIANGTCSDTDVVIIDVSADPDPGISGAGPFCSDEAAINLTAVTLGGTWSGTGITDPVNGTFDPTIAGVGDFTITYDLTNGACSSQGTTIIHVDEEVDATITGVPQICEIDPAFNLVAADLGGVWSGTGITNTANGTFNPTVAGPGLHTVTYSITNGTCSDTDTEIIDVSAEPNSTISGAGPFCSDEAAINLTASTAGGTWSGTGITDPTNGTFDPTIAGSGDFTITYDLTNGACSSQGTTIIHVDEEVDATITGVPLLCEFNPAFNLVAADPGGVWSGTGITNATNGTFDPTVAGQGLHTVTYSITNGTCSDI
ncbi:MAG: hypothetical protein PHE33_07305, partial [Bacteroidales bacterium]|nr:hypothetical protein [Bacteroidales bacterium]